MQLPQLILGIHAFSTLAMVGLIWFVQVVHYPLFAHVPEAAFVEYERRHQRRVTWLVGPLMHAELATAVLLAGGLVASVPRAWALLGLGLVVAVWASTFFVQVGLHTQLERGKDDRLIARLVASNWFRTAAWTARGVLAIAMMS